MVKVAIVHDFLTTYGGAERVVSQLHELYPSAPIYTLIADPHLLREHFPAATVHTSALDRSWFRSRPKLLLTRMPQAVESFDLTEYDVVISSSGAFSHGIITGPHTTHICYCHSPMRYAWDWHAEYLDEKKLRGLPRFIAELAISRVRSWDALAAKRVDLWLANSTVVRDRIAKYYRANSTVVFPPVNVEFFGPARVRPAAAQAYAISVSRLTPNKRIDLIIQACISLNVPLHIVGSGEDMARLKALAAGNELITFTGPLSEEGKRNELNGASCFVFAAEDDFGIAPVEAMSLGVPVIAYGKGGALDTVLDGKNGIFFDEPNAASLTSALGIFLKSGVSMPPEEIRVTALRFSEQSFKKNITSIVTHATVR
jgi:glycosyltransferase involved in cell wall biosynthesis